MQCHQQKILYKGVLHCNCNSVIYLITCKNCLEQYVGSATNFKSRFRIYKSHIKTNNDICETANHFNGMFKNDCNIFQFLSVQRIEQVYSNATDIEEILWHREKYWQSQLFPTTHVTSSLTDLYCSKRKSYRKQVFVTNYFQLALQCFQHLKVDIIL